MLHKGKHISTEYWGGGKCIIIQSNSFGLEIRKTNFRKTEPKKFLKENTNFSTSYHHPWESDARQENFCKGYFLSSIYFLRRCIVY